MRVLALKALDAYFVIGEKNYIQTERLPIVFSNERLELVYYYPF